MRVGVLPIIDHYYEPLFNPKHLRFSLRQERHLPGINFNELEQLEILRKFIYVDELVKFPFDNSGKAGEFFYNNPSFSSGDAEYLYNMIRLFKPKKIVEIGSGYSTLMARNAISQNISESPENRCEHICVEPFEQFWLEKIGVTVIRSKVEELGPDLFMTLEENDLLFIDSSHMIRPQGDVLFEYLEILPSLKRGVIVHIHDIFSPRDYLDHWIGEHLWNEQYLLEAYLSNNPDYKIIGATNFLRHKYTTEFSAKCPVFEKQQNREPGSFYIQKIK